MNDQIRLIGIYGKVWMVVSHQDLWITKPVAEEITPKERQNNKGINRVSPTRSREGRFTLVSQRQQWQNPLEGKGWMRKRKLEVMLQIGVQNLPLSESNSRLHLGLIRETKWLRNWIQWQVRYGHVNDGSKYYEVAKIQNSGLTQ